MFDDDRKCNYWELRVWKGEPVERRETQGRVFFPKTDETQISTPISQGATFFSFPGQFSLSFPLLFSPGPNPVRPSFDQGIWSYGGKQVSLGIYTPCRLFSSLIFDTVAIALPISAWQPANASRVDDVKTRPQGAELGLGLRLGLQPNDSDGSHPP